MINLIVTMFRLLWRNKDEIVVDGYSYRNKLIKQGLSGKTFLGQKISTKQPVAVKKIDRPDDAEYCKYLQREVDILSKINHDNIIKLFHHAWTDDALLLFFEYCPLGDLGHYLRNNLKPKDPELLSYFIDCANALDYLHNSTPPIIHGNLKLENILVAGSEGKKSLKLTGFGFAEMSEENVSTVCDNLDNNAREAWKMENRRQQYGFHDDIFALGLVMEEMISHDAQRSEQPLDGEYAY